jgi:Mg2+ and Co2+ transporter CorA
MKIKCTICNTEEVLDREMVEEIAGIINRYNLKAINYIKLLNMIRGKCLDSDEHSFVFDDAFIKEIGNIVDKDKKDASEIEKLVKENTVSNRELTEFEAKIKETKAKLEANNDRIKGLLKNHEECLDEIMGLTGIKDIGIWS